MDNDNVLKLQSNVDDLLAACKDALAFVLRAVERDYRAEGFDPAEHVTAKRLAAAIAAAEATPVPPRRQITRWPARQDYVGGFSSPAAMFVK